MTAARRLPVGASRQEIAVLRSADRRTRWVVMLAATLSGPQSVEDRVERLHAAVPMIGARLHREEWRPGLPPEVATIDGDPLLAPSLRAEFDLSREPPLRIAIDRAHIRIVLSAHHAAFDGRALVMLLSGLLGREVAVTTPSVPAVVQRRLSSHLRDAFRTVDRVAPSSPRATAEALATARVSLSGSSVTARIAAAAVAAVAEHNKGLNAPWRRVRISLGIGGLPGAGNAASYRRATVVPGEPVVDAVDAAIRDPAEPAELVSISRYAWVLAPVVGLFSDSLLVSNLGRIELPLVRRVEFFPVARGRSAVSFGAASVSGGDGTLSIRARDLTQIDADRLLERTVVFLEKGPR